MSTVAVTQSDNTLTAFANADYQWLDCNNGNQPIPDATEQIFIAQSPGSYAVQITENGCTQNSTCIDVLVTSNSIVSKNKFVIYPNPTYNPIQIDSEKAIKKIYVQDLSGKTVINTSNTDKVDLTKIAPGLYFLVMQFIDGTIEKSKIIKQS